MSPANDIHVLVVDDDEGMVATLYDILGAAGYSVDTAHSGPEAVERVGLQVPDCILMDVRMPGQSGVDAFREIKQLAPESAVIFMSAYAASTLVDEARREGALDVVPKPLDLERVLHLIDDSAQKVPVLVSTTTPLFAARWPTPWRFGSSTWTRWRASTKRWRCSSNSRDGW